jgi:hypothetical protein
MSCTPIDTWPFDPDGPQPQVPQDPDWTPEEEA